jgi:hypothetical protein
MKQVSYFSFFSEHSCVPGETELWNNCVHEEPTGAREADIFDVREARWGRCSWRSGEVGRVGELR